MRVGCKNALQKAAKYLFAETCVPGITEQSCTAMPVDQARLPFTMPFSHVQTTGNTANDLQVFHDAFVTCAQR